MGGQWVHTVDMSLGAQGPGQGGEGQNDAPLPNFCCLDLLKFFDNMDPGQCCSELSRV